MTSFDRYRHNLPALIVVAAALAGAVIGVFEIANTSIGWHLASGDWILEHRSFIRADPFSFTAVGTPWIDHEWLFQVAVSVANSLAGPAGLVLLRAISVAALAILLLVIGVQRGLSPAAALLLSLLCVAGARGRFFVRPELVTLMIVPAILWIFLERGRFASRRWLAVIGCSMVIGANSHGGVLVIPILLAGVFTAELVQMAWTRQWQRSAVTSGLVGILVAVGALLFNPYGWRLFTVPFHLAHLVNLDHIPNPEWISPSPAQAPVLYAAIVLAVVVLALRERRLVSWVLLAMASILALRHIRNIGLFFVIVPLAVAPALASWRSLTADHLQDRRSRRRANGLAVAAVLVLAVSMAIAPWPGFGFGYADNYYPESACAFLDGHGLPADRLYNDVRFGGYLIHRYGPDRGIFQDDRNEIHEPLLREIWDIFQTSDLEAWSALLGRYDIDTALVRYHQPLQVTTPDGEPFGERGFSALWFPANRWALVYWDDVAMVLVDREAVANGLIESKEFASFRPDDIAYLEGRLAREPALRGAVAADLRRALAANPDSRRARHIAALLERSVGTTGP